MKFQTSEELILEREIKGLRVISFIRIFLVASTISSTLVVGKSNFEKIFVAFLSLTIFVITIFFLIMNKRKKFILSSGYFGAFFDGFYVSILPYIWYQSVGGESVSPLYLLKNPTMITLSFTVLIINSFAIRYHYPLIVAIIVLTSQIGYSIYAFQDPRSIISENFVSHLLGETISLSFYYGFLMIYFITTILICYLTIITKKLIYEAISLEKINFNASRYFSPNVFAKIIASDDDFFNKGRKQKVVVLFSDIRDFTTISETLKPEDVMKLLKEYHSKMVATIFKHGGTLDKFIGDGIMATFGTPEESNDDLERAMKTAIDMRIALNELNQERILKGQVPLRQGIGIHVGFAIAGNIGTSDRMEYTVIGDTVNIASRIESQCKVLSKEILVSSDVVEVLKNQFSFDDLGEHLLKGKHEKIRLYTLSEINNQ
ncbi:MAG: adenylate/guanylate cyclase domain-containing protein [Leptospiraceae bacterium]|nr:adenylate/guanylate cyclase domain-containing protein [Leptospiraceae bacterium]